MANIFERISAHLRGDDEKNNQSGIFSRNLLTLNDGRVSLRDQFTPKRIASTVKSVAEKYVEASPVRRLQVKAATVGAKVAKTVAQGAARSGASVGLELNNRVFTKMGNNRVPELSIDPQASRAERLFQEILFGDEPVEDITTRIARAPGRANEFAQGLGFQGQNLVNERTAPFAIIGLTAMDFIGGGGKGSTLSAISKLNKPEDIAQLLRAEAKMIPDGMIDDVSKKLAAVTDPAKIQGVLDDAIKSTGRMVAGMRRVGSEIRATTRERGFITTAKASDMLSPEVKAVVQGSYNPLNNPTAFEEAKKLVMFNPTEANRLANATGKIAAEDLRMANAVSLLKISEAEQAGNITEARRMIELIAERSTPAGQGVQILSALNRLSPAGIIKYADDFLKGATKDLPLGKQHIKVTDEMAQDLFDHAKRIAKMADGEDKAVETALMLKKIHDQVPVGMLKKISTAQTMAQLINPKTYARNIVGNFGFAALENISDVVGAALDSPLSLITGKRSKTLPSFTKQAAGFKTGLRQGIRDALLGIDTYGVPTQFDLPSTAVFKGGVGEAAEKLLNLELRAADRAFYKAAYDGSLFQQMKAAKVIEPTPAMTEVAHYDALYRTFQDDSTLAKMFTGLKRAFNANKDFGLGDIILKYPKTPANLLARGVAYSPGGFMRTAYLAAEPLIGKPFNQKAFVESFSRALVGSAGLVGTGALLHRMGIITGQRDPHSDVANVQDVAGIGQYRINASALKRFVLSGGSAEAAARQQGDKLYSYDWFQPLAIAISIGANIDEGASKDSLVTTMLNSLESGIDTLAEQPLVQGVTNLFKFDKPGEAFMEQLHKIPSTFVPTFLNQIRQLVDNQRRLTYDPDSMHYAWNLVKTRVPGLSGTLPAQVDIFGKDQEVYQNGSNNPFNVFFNPAFSSKANLTPEAELVLSLYERTGETGQIPNVVKRTQTINGESVKLSPTQVTALQRFVGTEARTLFHSFASDPNFQALPDDKKIKYLSNVITDITTAGKIVVLGDRPAKPDQRVVKIIQRYANAQGEQQPQQQEGGDIFSGQSAVPAMAAGGAALGIGSKNMTTKFFASQPPRGLLDDMEKFIDIGRIGEKAPYNNFEADLIEQMEKRGITLPKTRAGVAKLFETFLEVAKHAR